MNALKDGQLWRPKMELRRAESGARGNELDAVTFARTRLGFEPDAVQQKVLDRKILRGMLNCTRQWGKSTVMAVKALHQAYCFPGTLTLVLSPSARQSGILVARVRRFADKLGVKTRKDGINPIS